MSTARKPPRPKTIGQELERTRSIVRVLVNPPCSSSRELYSSEELAVIGAASHAQPRITPNKYRFTGDQ